MDLEEIKRRLAKRLLSQKQKELAWSDVQGLADRLGPAERAELLQAVRAGRAAPIGRLMVKSAAKLAKSLAETEAATMVADSSLTLEELERIL